MDRLSTACGRRCAWARAIWDSSTEVTRGLISLLRGLDPTTTFQIANSVWYRNTFSFNQTFLDTTKKYFNAQVQGLNFADVPGSLSTINGWVNSNTAGKIPTILDDITADEVMFLINAIYFKGAWQYQFDPKATSPSTFTAADGTRQSVPFMNRPEHMKPLFRAGSAQGLAIAELPVRQRRVRDGHRPCHRSTPRRASTRWQRSSTRRRGRR